jgi:hypothetical protein
MKLFNAIACISALLFLAACSTNRSPGDYAQRNSAPQQSAATTTGGAATLPASEESAPSRRDEGQTQLASFTQPDAAQATQQATVERKIIRDAVINIEVAAPAEGQRKLTSIAEAHGGFVVTSESKQQENAARDSAPVEIVAVTLRVPATHFDATLAEIRAVGTRILAEKTTSKDVTEEFIDLDARLRTQRALETQFLEIMKRADKISDALEVHRQLAGVRTEIERVEGRRRFLENQAALSTINITLQPPAPLIGANTSGFFYSLKHAFGDGVDIAAQITLGIISFGIALLPVLLLVVLPLVLIWRLLVRPRLRRRPKPGAPAPPVADAAT